MANIERLTQLRRVIEGAPEDRLHMRTFSENAACGTAYCAAGWAAVDPWFQKNTWINASLRVGPDGFIDVVARMDGIFDDLAEIFGISLRSSEALFGFGPPSNLGPHAVSKAQVLKNIDRLLKGKRAKVYPCFDED